jgi:mRNA-degrading endonuclease RelE of RelBE toxin-antitoxin system
MVKEVVYTKMFERAVRKIKDASIKERVKKQVEEIIQKPDIGKPLRFDKKGERTVWVPPFRILYAWENETIYFLDFDKRDKVYR